MSEWDRIAPLATERLRLEPLTFEHVDLLVDLDSDAEVMRFINGGKPSSVTDVNTIVQASSGYRWAAFLRADGGFVGWFGMRPEGDRTYDLGYRLRRAHWGAGLATEGSLLLIELAFTRLGALRVCADTMTVNVRSRRVMEACGLRFARTFHVEWDEVIEGSEQGDVEYEILRDEYLRRAERGTP